MPRQNASLAVRREALLKKKQALLDDLASLDAQQRDFDRAQRLKQQAAVGKLADEAGLLAYDLETLHKLFTAVIRMSTKDPRAVGEFLGLDAILHGEVDMITVVDDQGEPLGKEEIHAQP